MEPTYKDLSDITPEEAYNELKENPNHELKEQYEFIIKKNSGYARWYAQYVIKGRFHEAEEYIKTDPQFAFAYAKEVIKGRWPEAEPYIMIDPQYAFYYVEDVIKGRWKEAEEYIKKDPCYAYEYAKDIIKGRWKEAEDIIKKSPHYAWRYAKDIIKERWPEAEDIIKTDPRWAYEYARDVIEGRWIEAEDIIKTGTNLFKYCKIIGERVPEKEHLLKGKTKVNYHVYFKIKLPAQDVNKEIANCIIGQKSKYLKEIQNNKDNAIESIRNLIGFGVIEESQVKELLEKIR